MKKHKITNGMASESPTHDLLALNETQDESTLLAPLVHIIRKNIICCTEPRGYSTPRRSSITEIVLDASEGFIPLWSKNTTLRWRFQERSLAQFRNPEAVKQLVTGLFAEAVLAWGDASPVRFTYNTDAWDFEILVHSQDNCNAYGCTLAKAFFPDAGRHQLEIYPKMFKQDRKEQIDTMCHEIGHIFGLRHFFAKVSETAWPSEVYGAHNSFSIMNYGDQSELTSDDKNDLRTLYHLAWNGKLTHVNGTPIKFVTPFHSNANNSWIAMEIPDQRQ